MRNKVLIKIQWFGKITDLLTIIFTPMKTNKYFAEDLAAMRIAAEHDMTYDYKEARRHGLTPQEALEDWDLREWGKDGGVGAAGASGENTE